GYPMVFRFLPERAKTPEVCAVAVSLSASALQYVPEALRTEELCLASVRRPEDESLGMFWDPQDSPAALQFVPERFRTERFCAEAAGADWRALQFVPDRLKTPAFCLRAVRESPKALAFVPEELKTEELCREAVRLGGGDVLEFVPRRLLPESAFLDAVLQDGDALEHVPDALKTPEMCMLAVMNSAYALAFRYVPDRLKTADMCLEAVRGSGYVAFGLTPPELRSEEMVWIKEEGHFRGVRISGWSPEWQAPKPAREAASLRPGPLAALAETILLGLAVGDATGVPYEFMKRGTYKAEPLMGGGGHGQPAGTWSDDTALALAFADALLPGGFDAEQAAENFQDWLYRGKFTARGNVFDVGRGTAAAIARMKDGVLPEACGGRERQENGNGSLMRIAPIVPALLSVSNPERRWDAVRRASSLTHAHPLSCLCCFAFEEFLRLLCLGRSRDSAYADLCIAFADAGFGGLKEFLSGLRGFGRLSRVLGGRLPELPEAEIRSGGFVVDTLEASLWCLLNSDSYAETVLKAAALGRDADTTACVAGAAAALCWGRESIPAEWIEGLAGREELLRIARKAAEQIRARDGGGED
ncbi:MAG: ADP-ribosylglycohydrolase family protein, partial [Desulfovibrio sp.]|nr:ADP-ribosylglycohydrolase family protein [Desulfovibrio sp.]